MRLTRLPVAVAVLEAVLLVSLSYAQFEGGKDLPSSIDPLADPLVSNLRWIEVGVWLAAPLLIGTLVAPIARRTLVAGGLAFGAVASGVVSSPLLEQLAASGWTLTASGRPPLYFFAPPGGWSLGYAIPVLIAIGILVAGSVATIEAALAAELAHRLAPPTTRPNPGR